MLGYIVSFYNKTLKVSLLGTEQEAEKELDINKFDTKVIAEELGQLIVENFGPKPPKEPLNFLIDPKDLILSFITKTKENSTNSDYLETESKNKLVAASLSLDSAYYSTQKIAPFVHQFVAIKKEILERYLTIANDLELELDSVLAWPLLLPKKTGSSGEAAIFVLKMGTDHLLALSEMGGIYHSGLIDKTKVEDGLEELISELSVYKREEPISKIFTFGVSGLTMSNKYDIHEIEEKDSHKLIESLKLNGTILEKQANLLNMLPVPEKSKKVFPPVYAAGAVLLLAIFGYFAFSQLTPKSTEGEQIAQNNEGQSVVLSEVEESTKSEESTDEDTIDETTQDLNKSYLRIRVENGTSVGGLAGNTRDKLAELEYDVISIGDAEGVDVEVTSVRINPKNEIYRELLSTDLLEIFTEVGVGEPLEEELDYDVLIIAGTNQIEEE